jgi:uncharacterized protein YndB with AHSA1/START domain
MNDSRPAAVSELGELDRSADSWRLRFVRKLAHSPERVWRALTEPTELEAWFPTTIDGERAADAALEFHFRNGEADAFAGRMIACEPPRLLEFMWGGDLIRFELEAADGGTRLTLFDTVDANGKSARDAAGWHVCLARLLLLLDRVNGADEAGAAPLHWPDVFARYRERFGPEASAIGPPPGHPEAG